MRKGNPEQSLVPRKLPVEALAGGLVVTDEDRRPSAGSDLELQLDRAGVPLELHSPIRDGDDGRHASNVAEELIDEPLGQTQRSGVDDLGAVSVPVGLERRESGELRGDFVALIAGPTSTVGASVRPRGADCMLGSASVVVVI